MKIEYRVPAWSADAKTIGEFAPLADEAAETSGSTGDRVRGFQPSLSKQPQDDDLFQSPVPFIEDRGNGRWRLAFMVEREHESADAAMEFLAAHGEILNTPGNFDLKVTCGETVVYVANCALTEFTPEPHSDRRELRDEHAGSGGLTMD